MTTTVLRRIEKRLSGQINNGIGEMDRLIHNRLCNGESLHDVQCSTKYRLLRERVDTLRRVSDIIDGVVQLGDE